MERNEEKEYIIIFFLFLCLPIFDVHISMLETRPG